MTLRQARELAKQHDMRYDPETGEIITRPRYIQARQALDQRNSLNFDIADLHATGVLQTDECIPELVTLKSEDGHRKTILTHDHITYRQKE